MSFRVGIKQVDQPITVEAGETILAAALRRGVDYPHGCQSGNCGACKSRLLAGDVALSPYSAFALTEDERQSGLILACRAVPWADSEVAWLDADEAVVHPRRDMVCRVETVDSVTHDVRRVRLAILQGGPYTFSAGQYARVTFAGQPTRDYSMANRPNVGPVLEFHIRHVPGGPTSGHVRQGLKPGDEVRVEGPFGAAYLRELHAGPMLALAGGSGLAPILCIVETALAKGMAQPIHLIFGVRDERDVYMEDRLQALAAAHPNFDVEIVLSDPSRQTRRPTGFVHARIADRLSDLDGYKVYMAGPPPMVEAATALCLGRGLRRQDIHDDAFYTEADNAAAGRATSEGRE